MALVLRKTITPKNVFLLKCMKGRKLSTAVYKKNTAPFFRNVMKRNNCKKTQRMKSLFWSKRKNIQSQRIIKYDNRFHKNISCPNFTGRLTCLKEALPSKIKKTSSLLCYQMQDQHFLNGKLLNNLIVPNSLKRSLSTSVVRLTAKCACPASCSCLPPPCNTPAKCIQYMTGYYYYPYGTWFCGPYHVSTGACGPCKGPIKPCGPCGPPCGPCGPLCCCGVAFGDKNLQSSSNTNNNNNNNIPNTQWPMFYTNNYMGNPYMQYYPQQYPNNYPQQNQYGQYNPENANFVPYNVPNPQTLDQAKKQHSQTQIQDASTKSSISWPPPDKPQISAINQTTPLMPNIGAGQPAKAQIYKTPYTPPPLPFDSKPTLSKTNPFTKPKLNARAMLSPNLSGICYYTTRYNSKNRSNNIKPRTRKNMNSIKGFSAEKLRSKKRNKNDWNIFEGKQDNSGT